jgi:hypothetical protein
MVDSTATLMLKDDIFRAPMVLISAGRVPGCAAKEKYGTDSDVDTTYKTVWSESVSKVFRTTEVIMTISSDDADDIAAGSGAQTVFIEGVNALYEKISETLIMDGVDEVDTDLAYMVVTRMYVVTAGASLVNEGNIYVGTGTVTAGKPAVVEAKIPADFGQTAQAFDIVPAGHTYYLCRSLMSAARTGTTNVDIRLRWKANGGAWRSNLQFILFQNNVVDTHIHPEVFPEKSIIDFQAKGSSGGTAVSVKAEFIDITDAEFVWPI